MRKMLFMIGLSLVPLLAIGGYAAAGGQSSLDAARAATAAYHDIEAARTAGYGKEMSGPLPDKAGNTCIANGAAGAMGEHWVSVSRVLDPSLDPADPEVLVYERRNNGTLKLVAVEYVVFESAASPPGSEKHELFGAQFEYLDKHNRYGLPPFYALHAWIWKPNHSDVAGIFSPWNPKVSC